MTGGQGSEDEGKKALLRFLAAKEAGMAWDGGKAFDGANLSAGEGGTGLRRLDLSGASLRRANLSEADLSGADLSGASCSGILLRGTRLEQATLAGADLVGGDFTEADGGQANLSGCLLEDAVFVRARLRFAVLSDAVMDGADFAGADLWGAMLAGVAAERTSFLGARLDEARMAGADLAGADLTGATLRRADLTGANLRQAVLRDVRLEGARLSGADLRGAVLPHLDLSSCDLLHARVSGCWMERTRVRAVQFGAAIGEEQEGDFAAAREGYIALEQNFRSLGNLDDASWAFRRRRRMGKRLHAQQAGAALRAGALVLAYQCGMQYLGEMAAEWICDYGESVTRVLRTLLMTLLVFAALYWATGSLVPRAEVPRGVGFGALDYLLFSLDSMTTVGTGEVGLRPGTQLGVLLSSVETVLGTVLLGLLGFVLGGRMRR